MSKRTIPLEEKALVIERLIEGASTREAIKGTSIKSNSTAALLARNESHIIAQKQREYVSLIEDYAFNTRIERARLWGEALYATKRLPIRNSEHLSFDASRDGYVTEPDWPTRIKALMYLDKLEGIVPSQPLNLTLMQQINKNNS